MKKLVILFVFLLIFINSVSAETIIEENNYLVIERSSTELKSRLSQRYIGFEYVVKSIYDKPVTIKSVSLWGDSIGKTAYLSTQKTNKQARAELWSKGKKLALPTLSLSLLGSAVAMPFVSAKNSCADKLAQVESEDFNKPNIKNETINPDKKLIIKTLTVKKHTPTMKLIYVNPITDEDMSILMK